MIQCPECRKLFDKAASACPHCNFSVLKVDGFATWVSSLAQVDRDGFKEEYFATLAALEAQNFWFRSRNTLILWAIKKYFPHLASFMEVGCGTGFVLSGVSKQFPNAKLVGSELFTAGLIHAAKRLPGIEFVQMDARRMPYVEEFDVVGAFDVIEHIKEDEVVLQNLRQAVPPGGGVLITVPQHEWLWSPVDEYACHVRRYSADDLHAKITNAGLEILHSTSFVSALLPAMFVSRWRSKRKSVDEIDATSELKLNPIINAVFERILSAEIAIIKAGIRLPCGGSRLVVAKRI